MIRPSSAPDEIASGSALPEKQSDTSLPEKVAEFREKAFSLIDADKIREEFRMDLWKKNPEMAIKYEVYAKKKGEYLVASRARGEQFLRSSFDYVQAHWERLCLETLGYKVKPPLGMFDFEEIAARWTGYNSLYLGLSRGLSEKHVRSAVPRQKLSFDPLLRIGIRSLDDFTRIFIRAFHHEKVAGDPSSVENFFYREFMNDSDPSVKAFYEDLLKSSGDMHFLLDRICPYLSSLDHKSASELGTYTAYCFDQYKRIEMESQAGRSDMKSHHVLYNPEAEPLFLELMKRLKSGYRHVADSEGFSEDVEMICDLLGVAGARIPITYQEMQIVARSMPFEKKGNMREVLLAASDQLEPLSADEIFTLIRPLDVPPELLARLLPSGMNTFMSDLEGVLHPNDFLLFSHCINIPNQVIRRLHLDQREIDRRLKSVTERYESVAQDVASKDAAILRSSTQSERYARYLLNLWKRRKGHLGKTTD